MRRATHFMTFVCLLIPMAAKAADSGVAPAIDCKTAKPRPPGVDWKTYAAYCGAQASAERAASAHAHGLDGMTCTGLPGGPCVSDNIKSYTDPTLFPSGIPTLSDYDIWAQFIATRDNRYLTDLTNATPSPRRLSWLYPDDGCFARAEQVDVQMANNQKARPYKLFAFGDPLRVYTDNSPSGIIYWGWHTVPIVKNTAGEIIVLDAALSPCRPLPWKEWLALMVDNIDTGFTNPAAGQGVAVGDSWAYWTSSLASNEPSHSAESVDHEQRYYLPLEWDRQKNAMSRDVNVILGPTPPWSGYSCVSMKEVLVPSSVSSGTNATVTATCPWGTLAVGGGYTLDSPTFAISKDAMSGNAWQMVAKNTGTSTQGITTSALCLIGAPAANSPTGAAYVTSIQGNVVNINANSYASSSASCGAGKLVSGGYTTTLGTSPAQVMRIYGNKPSSSTTWTVSAQNTTSSPKTLTSFAYCLNNTNFSITQKTSGGVDSSGGAGIGCSYPTETLVGGGWVFPRQTAYTVLTAQELKHTAFFIHLTPPPIGVDANAKAFAACLTHP